MKLDVLAFGVHPDDVELSCAGTLINEIRKGRRAGVVDLTAGELGTRGTAATRAQEASKASEVMGLSIRENLGMRDGFFKNDEAHQLQVIRAIRKFKPEIILANILEDRHPDHGRAGQLVRDAAFLAGLKKIETTDDAGANQERWRPKMVLHYIQDRLHEPDLVIDISDVYEQRLEAVKVYATQFHVAPDSAQGTQTYISTPDFMEALISRWRLMGKRIGVKYAEGYVSEKSIGIRTLQDLILIET
ncbi:MAG: bacillithiol biosynthesis deacetylase BshB1 [Chitinophagaceae bacterium]|jgi:bacillithiol biosynthesis deacetylase BshB1